MYKYVHIDDRFRERLTPIVRNTSGDCYSIRVDDCFDVCPTVYTCVCVCVCVREKERELTMFVHTVPEVDEHIDPPYRTNRPDKIFTGNNSIVILSKIVNNHSHDYSRFR